MALIDILAADRVEVVSQPVASKQAILQRVARLLARGSASISESTVLSSLMAREALHSTGVGAGVAVPHATMAAIEQQVAALVLCQQPVEFDAIDGKPVSILFALVGPQGQSAQHLKTLAQVSRVLRPEEFRDQLVKSISGAEAYALLRARTGAA